METFSDWDRLDCAAYHASMIRSVRTVGWRAAVVGALLVAFALVSSTPLLAVPGAVLVAAGGWNFMRPSVSGLIVDGTTMVLIGVGLCAWRLWLADDASLRVGKEVLAGLIMTWRGIVRLRTCWEGRQIVHDAPMIARVLWLALVVGKRDAKHDETVVEFATNTRYKHRNRVGLFAEGAVVLLEQDVVRIEKRADISIEPHGSTWLDRKVKVIAQMSGLERKGTMTREHLERFERWKLGMAPATSIAA